jgi:cytochrome c peroxidase
MTPLDPGPSPEAAQVELGRMLFFDKILSGNRDISCATCHHPTLATVDKLPVSIGTGGRGLGTGRTPGEGRVFIPRNAPDIFNRASPEIVSMFADSRLVQQPDGTFISPAGDALPDTLPNVLAVQAMFPVTSRDEMRGHTGDRDVAGALNELALINDADMPVIWDTLMVRLLDIPAYRELFQAAYPDVPLEDLHFAHAAQAIAAFEAATFTFTGSPWDRYLAGDDLALTNAARRGALLFYGEAECARCHSGTLLSDQQHYNIAVPQVGPGKGDEAPLDLGRGRETGETSDRFAFRTPPLRNVALTGPYMHNGAFRTITATVRHHLAPEASLRGYDVVEHLPPSFHGTFQDDPALIAELLAERDATAPERPLTAAEFDDLMAFLAALTDPAATNIEGPPPAVPSGLPVSDQPVVLYLPLVTR